MEYGRKYTQDACQVTGGYQMELTAESAAEDGTLEEGRFTCKGDYTMLQSLKALQFDTDMVLSTSAPSQGTTSLDVDAAMRMNLETGKLYFQSGSPLRDDGGGTDRQLVSDESEKHDGRPVWLRLPGADGSGLSGERRRLWRSPGAVAPGSSLPPARI